MSWQDNLDPASPAYKIGAATARYLRVVAGPGTGKSFALKRRVARLLDEGTRPDRILPVTFTNVAAEDLQREMLQVGVTGCKDIKGSTLHSLCMRILSRQQVLEAIGRIPRPLNNFEMEPLLYDLPNSFGNKKKRAERIRAYEAAWARLQHEQPINAATRQDNAFEMLLRDWLQFHKGMLIGEIIPYVYTYLRDNPSAPERELYDYVLVDEYQDLNKAEQAVIDLLCANANLLIVGDDDQSLYSFKYAHPAGIREFPKSHIETIDYEILECRRCPTKVVSMANSLISHNTDREPRQLIARPANGVGEVEIVQYTSLENEAVGIARFVNDLIENQGYRPGEILILAQRRSIGNPIGDALIGRRIPTKSYYREGVLDNGAAQERLAMLRLLANPLDRIALRWLLGLESNDFRSNAYARLRSYCEANGGEPWDVLVQLRDGRARIPNTRHLVTRFEEIETELNQLRQTGGLEEFVRKWLQNAISADDPFHNLVLDLAPTVEDPKALLDAIIDAVAKPDVPPDVAEVRIMSLHKSKGLSSSVVIIAGCVEGLLPTASGENATPAEKLASLEEQRRLFFVGLTRVKANPGEDRPGILVITSSRTMPLADAMQSGIRPARVVHGTAHVHASQFVRELGPDAPTPKQG